MLGVEPQINKDGSKIQLPTSILDLGVLSLEETLPIMQRLVRERSENKIQNLLVVVKHPAVYTQGRGMQLTLRRNAPVPETLESYRKRLPYPLVEVERGGDITYHDEGQFIGYPVVKLFPKEGYGIKEFIQALESILIAIVERLAPHLKPSTSEIATGIWVQNKKIASLGIAVKKWVTYHGFALNLSTDLAAFEQIRPCGLEAQQIANLSTLASKNITHEEVLFLLKQSFTRTFNR